MEVNSFQLFDTDMTVMTQFRNDNIIVAGGVIDLFYLDFNSFFKLAFNIQA